MRGAEPEEVVVDVEALASSEAGVLACTSRKRRVLLASACCLGCTSLLILLPGAVDNRPGPMPAPLATPVRCPPTLSLTRSACSRGIVAPHSPAPPRPRSLHCAPDLTTALLLHTAAPSRHTELLPIFSTTGT